jgi:diguanylate cyclase (GGDEF)-like protein
MEDFPTQSIQALSAHIEGLEAAFEALPTDASMGASLRRIARSLASAADAEQDAGLASAARRIEHADDDALEGTTSEFLRRVESIRRSLTPEEIQVLLVEDNRTVAVAMQAYLKGPAYAVHHAATAREAEQLLAQRPIDIVLLDLILPDRDGRDLLIQMREDRATATIPVIVLSAKEGAVPKAECLAVGAREFLEKPVEPAVLRAAVARHARPLREQTVADSVQAPGYTSRAGLVESYEPLRAEAQRGSPAALALLTVNDFEAVIETLGEEAADRLVAVVAEQMAAGLEGRQIAGRWGRAEIVTLLPAATATEARDRLKSGMARLAAEGVLEAYPGVAGGLSFSAGVAVAEAGQDLREVVSAAEESLHRARAAGRGVVVTADDEEPERPPRVLLVEDDRVTATLVHHRLVREGFEVMDFLNGEDAYEWAVDSSFDLAILDVKVPGMDGFEVLERLRAIPRFESTPIVMLTGLGGEADVIRGLELGANDYMLKPFSPTELLARVRRLVHAGAPGPPEAEGPQSSPEEIGAH